MMNCGTHFIACAALASISLGCGDNARPLTADTAPQRTEASPASDPAEQVEAAADPGDAVDVQIKDYDALVKLIESKRDKVVVMDCWSTWCQPCMQEFHNLVELHRQYGPEKLACISLSFNYEGAKRETPDEHRDEVLRFLREQGAKFDNVISSVPADDLYKLLKFKTASVPAVFVYNQQGELAQQFSGEVSYDDVRKVVADLMEGKETAEE